MGEEGQKEREGQKRGKREIRGRGGAREREGRGKKRGRGGDGDLLLVFHAGFLWEGGRRRFWDSNHTHTCMQNS